jgi:glutathione S-transferase
LLEELGLPYERVDFKLDRGQTGGEDYKKIHPLNKFPVLRDGETTVFESLAIMQYIMDKYGAGSLRPEIDNAEYGQYLQWFQFGECSLAPALVSLMYQRTVYQSEQRSEAFEKSSMAELDKQLSLLETKLGDHEYILKSGFSAADISVGYCLLLARFCKANEQFSDRIIQYWNVIKSREAWRRASG